MADKKDYMRSAMELQTTANRNGTNVKAKCSRCFDLIALVSKMDDVDALAQKLATHKEICARNVVLVHL